MRLTDAIEKIDRDAVELTVIRLTEGLNTGVPCPFSRSLISPCTQKKMPWHHVVHYLRLLRGGAIGSTPAFGNEVN